MSSKNVALQWLLKRAPFNGMRGKRDFENGLYEDYNDQVYQKIHSIVQMINFVLRRNSICCLSWLREGAGRPELALSG